jgi:hypothetical protein
MSDVPDAAEEGRGDARLEKLWQRVNERLRKGPVNRGLWDAAAAARPLTIHEGTLIVAVATREKRLAGYLETAANRAMVQQIMEELAGQPLALRVIEGESMEDWHRVLEIDRLVEERERAEFEVREARRDSTGIWDHLNETLVRMFTGGRLRRPPSELARMLARALPLIHAADYRVRREDPGGEETHDKQLNRVFEKVGLWCDMPPVVVALEYLRYRSTRRSEGEEQP